jgi:hypothetical protein
LRAGISKTGGFFFVCATYSFTCLTNEFSVLILQ